MRDARLRPAWIEVDLDAVAQNVASLLSMVAPSRLCAVVKADAYGHGAVQVAKTVLSAGASWLGVAMVEEGIELREAGIEAPILVLSEAPADAVGELLRWGLTPTVYSEAALEALVERAGGEVNVQLKLDSGMARAGAEPEAALRLALAIERSPRLVLGGVWTHFAVADRPGDPFTAHQIEVFRGFLDELARAGISPGLRHAANTAASTIPEARFDMVRCGIGIYGLAPNAAVAARLPRLRQAVSLKAKVRSLRLLPQGTAPSYGRARPLRRDSWVANLPVGYADGVPWRLFAGGGEVLVGGRRRALAGAVTMDQILVDCEDDPPQLGEEVVLLGTQGSEVIGVEEWAERVGTIPYEIVCSLSRRLPRVHIRGGLS
jgi:alanine racemase